MDQIGVSVLQSEVLYPILESLYLEPRQSSIYQKWGDKFQNILKN